jgi:hypothetical protein
MIPALVTLRGGVRAPRGIFCLMLAVLAAGCASSPPVLSPYRAETLGGPLTGACGAAEPGPGGSAPAPDLIPEGLAVIRGDGREMIVVAAGACVLTIDVGTGQPEVLALRGELAAPSMLDGTAQGLALSSRVSGATLRIYLGEDTTSVETLSGFHAPQGIRLLPGGHLLIAESAAGRILRVGPNEESRLITVADKLAGPVGIVIGDGPAGFVTERAAGQVTEFSLRSAERRVITEALNQPEGIALLADRRLVVADTGKRRVVAVDPQSGDIQMLADNLPIGDTAAPDIVTGVAVGPDGAIYVSSDIERTVLKLTPRVAPRQD